jgi:transposase
VGPVQQDSSWQQQQGYGLANFTIDWANQQVRCPQGQLSQNWHPGVGKRGEEMIQVFFAPAVCQGCEMKALCTKSQTGGRSLTLSPQPIHEALQQRRREQGSPEFQHEYAVRSGIEGSLSQGVRRSGMRQCRYRGEEKTHLQMTAIAAAINLVRLDTYLERTKAGLPPRRTRPPSPLARLQDREAA